MPPSENPVANLRVVGHVDRVVVVDELEAEDLHIGHGHQQHEPRGDDPVPSNSTKDEG